MTGIRTKLAAATLLAVVSAAAGAQAGGSAPGAAVREVFSHTLPRVDGNRLRVQVVEVTYPPGGASRPHSHPCAVVGYVLAGAIRTRVQGEQEAVYHAGQTFYEAPNGVHAVSANASATESARFLAYFTCDRATALSVPVAAHPSASHGGR
jgi:quercetin dioxygenase-like cupin family protein